MVAGKQIEKDDQTSTGKAEKERIAIQGSAFDKFEGVSYKALEALNEKEADKEIKRVNRLLRKMKERGQEILKKNRFDD